MPSYTTFTTARTTLPDAVALTTAVRAAVGDVTAVLAFDASAGWRGKKVAAWTAPEVAAVQTLLDTTPALTPQLDAQRFIDTLPLWAKAEALALIDQFNVLRAFHSLAAITPAQALAAIRTKAGTL